MIENENIRGLEITIENPTGSLRHGADWIQKMANDYGYIEGTIGADGDEMDCFLGPALDSDKIFIIEQVKLDRSFDEHKVMIGFSNLAEAKDAYYANYPEGWEGFKSVKTIRTRDFWNWYENLKTKYNRKEHPMPTNDPYKFGSHNAQELTERGKSTYGTTAENAKPCTQCEGSGQFGLTNCGMCGGNGKHNGMFENKKEEIVEKRRMYGKTVTKVTIDDRIDRYEVDGKIFKTIKELEDYIPELKANGMFENASFSVGDRVRRKDGLPNDPEGKIVELRGQWATIRWSAATSLMDKQYTSDLYKCT